MINRYLDEVVVVVVSGIKVLSYFFSNLNHSSLSA
jgi:hypothetical protein